MMTLSPGEPPLSADDERPCPRHPKVSTRLTCGRCGQPICPRCTVHTPVGLRCTSCGRQAPVGGQSLRAVWVCGGLVLGVLLLLALIPGHARPMSWAVLPDFTGRDYGAVAPRMVTPIALSPSGDTRQMHYTLTAGSSYYQFWLLDGDVDRVFEQSDQLWHAESASIMRLAVSPGLLAIGTDRYGGEIPVVVDVREDRPTIALDAWDQVVECSITLPSGQLLVSAPLDEYDLAPRIMLAPGTYRAVVLYAHLRDDGPQDTYEGPDEYTVILWPGELITPRVVKAHTGTTEDDAASGASSN